MGHKDNLHALFQLEGNEAALYFQTFMRMSAREALHEIMLEEVALLCGPKYFPDKATGNRRAGNEKGVFYDNGEKHSISRPRVRNKKGEVELQSYQLANKINNISGDILRAVQAGISSRSHVSFREGRTISKSEFSRQWIAKGAEKIEELRSRDLSLHEYFGLMLDGVRLSSDLTAIVALGITTKGEKHVLDFSLGWSESCEVASDLIRSIRRRGFSSKQRLLCVLDGSDALQKAVLKHFPDAVIQRCLVHKERNLLKHLGHRHHAECRRLMNRLRKVQGSVDGIEALHELSGFLKSKNASAYNSLLEAGDQLISLHLLEAPSTLHISLLSTNAIENTIKNLRRMISRNNRWRAETSQPDRWLASGLLYAENGFRSINGKKDLPCLIESLQSDFLSIKGGTITRPGLQSDKEKAITVNRTCCEEEAPVT